MATATTGIEIISAIPTSAAAIKFCFDFTFADLRKSKSINNADEAASENLNLFYENDKSTYPISVVNALTGQLTAET